MEARPIYILIRCVRHSLAAAVALAFIGLLQASSGQSLPRTPTAPGLAPSSGGANPPAFNLVPSSITSSSLQTGIELTRAGRFQQAVPYLQKTLLQGPGRFAARFDLALCYTALRRYQQALPLLDSLRHSGHATPQVNNLLAQAWIGAGHPRRAWQAFRAAARQQPKNLSLYLFVADACLDGRQYVLGLRVVDAGLNYLPRSARLHYQRAELLSHVHASRQARRQLKLVMQLAPRRAIARMAAAQLAMSEGHVPQALQSARAGLQLAPSNPALQLLLGLALLRSGAVPGDAEFAQAGRALRLAAALRPQNPQVQLALGRWDLLAGRLSAALWHLQTALQLWPSNPAVYPPLAVAYRQLHHPRQAQKVLAQLANLNQARIAAYRQGGRHAAYSGSHP